ncbi:MAG: response regulator transcription factor [Deltaproteobacteria bacterium]|nr:response regulator transcription factor [Deltaproteobacteria bacterium]
MFPRPERLPEPGSTESFSLDESRMRILLVADRPAVAAGIRAVLEKSSRCLFELAHELELARAAARLRGPIFDLLLIDLGLSGVRRAAVIDVASELSTRLPVVALSGTEAFAISEARSAHVFHARLHEADLPSLLLRTRRRARRLGAVALAPVFCRLDHPGA